jgi:predicted MFS family arabinose efflux permease
LLAIVSVGAVLGSVALGWIKKRLDANMVVAVGTCGLAVSLVLFGLARDLLFVGTAALLAGAAWTVVLTELYVSAQLALPNWVLGRGLSIFLTVIFGSVTLGSTLWGFIAAKAGVEAALFAAAAGALLAIPISWPWKLRSEEIGVSVPPVGAQPVA